MTSQASDWNCPEVDELADQIGSFIQYWGFKKVHGRIWATLYLSKEPLDATEIRQRLRISKALVSLSVRDLINHLVIEEIGKSSRGTILYRANPNLKQAIIKILKEREKVMLERIADAQLKCDKLGAEFRARLSIDCGRVTAIGEMVAAASLALDSLIQAEDSAVSPVKAASAVVAQLH